MVTPRDTWIHGITHPCLAMEISILASMLEAFFSSLVGSVTTTVFPLLDELLAGVVAGGEETLVVGDVAEVTDGDGVVEDTLEATDAEDSLAAAAEMETDKTEEEATVKGELLVVGAEGLAEVDPFNGGGLVEELAGGPVVMFGGGPAGGLADGPAGGLAGGLPGGPAGGLAGGFTGGLAGGLAGGLG